MKYIVVLDMDGKTNYVKLFATMDEYGESLADDDDTRTVIQPVEGA